MNKFRKSKGFTLIITISLLVLLTIVGIGLLSLSAVSLRASSQGSAMSAARSNARMALMLALGDLQKTMGPDKAISAPSGIVSATPAKNNLTGAWASWDMNPNAASLNYATEKNTRFRKWLVSDKDLAATWDRNYPTTPATSKVVDLVGSGSLGTGAADTEKVKAGLVPIERNGVLEGNYAWHISDEAVKARINSYRDPSQNETLAKKRALMSGQRPDASVVTATDGSKLSFLPSDLTPVEYGKAAESSGKLISLNQADVPSLTPRIGKFRNSVTPYSLGLLTNVRSGGLQEDLTSLFEGTSLPIKYNAKRLYDTTHKITGVSDPRWTALASYYNIYKSIATPDASPTYSGEPPQTIFTTAHVASTGFFPGPVIARAEVLFSFVTRDSHAVWTGGLANYDPSLKRMGHLVYTPVVTLYNPYNVSLKFDKLQIVIRNVPIAFRFFVNGKPQMKELVSINELFVNGNEKGEKSFAMDIANWTGYDGGATSGPIVMKPGQTLVCSPALDPSLTFRNGQGKFFDFQNNLTGTDVNGNVTVAIPAKPGFAGKSVGYDIDWLTPSEFDDGISNDNRLGVLGLADNDDVYIEYAVKVPTRGIKDHFEVGATITVAGKSRAYGGLNFQYADDATLKKYFTQTYRYPQSGAFKASSAYHSNSTSLSAQGNVKSFALFSATARTTNGGVYETNSRSTNAGAINVLRDGRLAGKPFLHNNPARALARIDMKTETPGMQSHELNFLQVNNNVDDLFEIDATNRGNVLTGNTTTRGIKAGSFLELPTGPMLSISDFRRSNALTTSYLPSFTQPVSNSCVSPLMDTSKVLQTGVISYPLLDHSVLANHALYDKFYFSTIAPYGGKSSTAVFQDFMNGKAPLLSQAYQPYLPQGKTANDALAELLSGGKPALGGYLLASQYLMVRGAFNVNSTSVQAWKAMLASMKGLQIPTLWPKTAAVEMKSLVNTNSTPVLPMSLVNGGNASNAIFNPNMIDNAKSNEWNGYRELNEVDLEKLATAIVKQVRARGPFLSMSEFVNRQIGANSTLTRMGALQAAIEDAGLNAASFASQIPVAAADVADQTLYKHKTPEAATGNPAEGAPGWINQGDLMHIIEPLATVRADTFVIRVCGESLDFSGRLLARAFAEAVVQRVADYVNPVDAPTLNVYDAATANATNKSFGRRIKLVSFRWLSPQEV